MATVMVTGGGGYIGSVLSEQLVEAGHNVRILDRFFFGTDLISDLAARPDIQLVKDDIRYVPAEAFQGVDVVMHLAGISNDPASDLDPAITNDINLDATVRVAELAKAAGVSRFVFASSCSIYGAGETETLTEESGTAPVSHYARTKIDSEKALLGLNDESFAVTFLRNATVYGLSRRMRFDLVINIMTLYAYRNRKIYVTGGGAQWRPLVHVTDVARAFLAVMDADRELVAGEAFNVGSNEQNYQISSIAQMVRDVVPNTALEMVPDDPDKRSYNVSFDKIQNVLGFKVERSAFEGIVEVKQALERGRIDDVITTKTVSYYKYLLDAERILKEVTLRGAIF